MAKETRLQHDILIYLAYRGVEAWRNNTGAFYRRGHMIKYGTLGSTDIIGVLPNGRFLGIETKTEKGKLSNDQISFHKRVMRNNAAVIVTRNMDDATEKIEELLDGCEKPKNWREEK